MRKTQRSAALSYILLVRPRWRSRASSTGGSRVGRIKESIKDTRGEKGEHNYEQIEERSLFFFLSLLLSHTFLSFSVSVSLSHPLSILLLYIYIYIYPFILFCPSLSFQSLDIYPWTSLTLIQPLPESTLTLRRCCKRERVLPARNQHIAHHLQLRKERLCARKQRNVEGGVLSIEASE